MGPSAPALACTALLPPKAGGGAVWEERTEQEGPGHGEAMRSLQRPAQRHSASLNTAPGLGETASEEPHFLELGQEPGARWVLCGFFSSVLRPPREPGRNLPRDRQELRVSTEPPVRPGSPALLDHRCPLEAERRLRTQSSEAGTTTPSPAPCAGPRTALLSLTCHRPEPSFCRGSRVVHE